MPAQLVIIYYFGVPARFIYKRCRAFMKHGHLYIVSLTMTLLNCTADNPSFAVYDIDPFREAVVKNHLQSYVEYGYIDGKLAEADSVVFDARGRITCKISKGYVNERWFTYDSLDRVIFETQRSDIYVTVRTKYQLEPHKRLVIKQISLGNRGDSIGELNTIEYLKYDDQLSRILTRTVSHTYDSSTMVFEYNYDGNRILKKVQRVNGTTGEVTEYQYKGKNLNSINRRLDPMFNITDYISPLTGLMDSTLNIRYEDDTVMIYYKYYRR